MTTFNIKGEKSKEYFRDLEGGDWFYHCAPNENPCSTHCIYVKMDGRAAEGKEGRWVNALRLTTGENVLFDSNTEVAHMKEVSLKYEL